MNCFTARCVARRRPGSLWSNIICALTRKTLTLLLANNKGADQPAHPCSLFSAFVICYLKSKVKILQMFLVGFIMMQPLATPLTAMSCLVQCHMKFAAVCLLLSTHCLLVPSVDILCKQSGPISGPGLDPKCCTLIVFLKDFFKKSCLKCF